MGKLNIRVLSLCLALALCMPLATPVRAAGSDGEPTEGTTLTEVPTDSEGATDQENASGTDLSPENAQENANEDGSSPENDQGNANESPDQGGETGEDAQEPNQSPENDQEMTEESPAEDPEAAVPDFTDVPTTHTFYTGITSCAKKGIVAGYADGTFKPAASVTRAQFCVMLSRAFYAKQAEALDTEANKAKGWFVPNAMALKNAGVLTNTSFAAYYDRPSVMDLVINRYDMAQLMTNIMKAKGFTATTAQKNAAQAKITDYKNVPTKYQDAVKNVYALGIISGYADGRFGGTGNMTRGAGATVIDRMVKYAPAQSTNPDEYDDGKDMKPETPATPSTPSTGTTGSTTGNTGTSSGNNNKTEETPVTVTSIKTSTTVINNGSTKWTVADNGYGTGKLNNGKAITEANVRELLAEAQKVWPTGMSWKSSNPTNFYDNKGSTQAGRQIGYVADTSMACGGFAVMISDYLFGKTGNPLRRLSDNTQVRPGDIVINHDANGNPAHIMIATGTVENRNGTPWLSAQASGNSGGQVNWNGARYTLDSTYATVYTRYPA